MFPWFEVLFGYVFSVMGSSLWFSTRLKKLYPEKYDEFGDLTFGFFSFERVRAQKNLSKYIVKGKFLELDDKTLRYLGFYLYPISIVNIASTAAMILFVIAFIILILLSLFS